MKDNETEKNKNGIKQYIGFICMLILFFAVSRYTNISARSDGVLMIKGNAIPVSAFTGVFSAIGNLCIIFIVVFYKKFGFVTSMIILVLIQFPSIVIGMIMSRTLMSIPGLFSNLFTIIAIIIIYRRNRQIDRFQTKEIENLKEQQRLTQRLFEQTATALVNAIDAKDRYSRGHSVRVAEYSQKLARLMGKSDEECHRIYYTALLHDVGKIGIADTIINKDGKLLPQEYDIIKQHPVIGYQILKSITEYPYLSFGAYYHHERYDGKGYPSKLKGEDIPEVARIISVADAYDAMTSNRSYRNAIPQQLVREEIVKGSGTQFDPYIAKLMQHLIDVDTEYKMKERTTITELAGKSEMHFREFKSDVSEGILITPCIVKISLRYIPDEKRPSDAKAPAMVLFDSLDGIYHSEDTDSEGLNYFEYCEIGFNGGVVSRNVRDVQTIILSGDKPADTGSEAVYDIEAVRYKDHVLILMDDGLQRSQTTIALPDSARFSYIGITGEYCTISDFKISKSDEKIEEDYITRIAPEISYIDVPAGDIPNVQIDGYRRESSQGIPIKDRMKITFHTMSLPTARLVWHCPYIDVFYSDNKRVNGNNYREYALIRLDGESWKNSDISENVITVNKEEGFDGWEEWKRINKEGFDVEVYFTRKDDTVVVSTRNLGLYIKNTIRILDGTEKLYAAITGDQCAITNIKII